MKRPLSIIGTLIAALILTAIPAKADTLRPGYIEFKQTGTHNWQLFWNAPMSGGVRPETQPIIPGNCQMSGEPTRERMSRAMLSRYRITCDGGLGGKHIGLSNFGGAATDIIIRYIPSPPAAPQTLRLTAQQPIATIAQKAGRGQVAWSYFVIGIEHIIFGLDHLLFVLCLVLLIRGGWTIIKTVTAFTVAHSITLAGAMLGWFGLPQQPVEAIIALSILFLASEIAKRGDGPPRLSERFPWIVAFLFGLLHGFGFAGALSDIGLPQGEAPMALLTFNLGVEAGQIGIVIATLMALTLLNRIKPAATQPAIKIATYAIGITASIWLIERIFV